MSVKALGGVALLWGAVIASGLAVIDSAHTARSLVNELELLRRKEAQLQVAWGQYLLEQGALSAYSRVEQIALKELEMKVPEGQDIVVIEP